MPRIPDNEIERLKQEIAVQRLIEGAGHELKKSGKDWITCCPFHRDDTASLVVTPAKNLWHCFGCGVGGGPIDWVMKVNGVSFRHAVELLREGITPGIASLAAVPVKASTVRQLEAPVQFGADDQALLNQTVRYYHERLLATSEARTYLEARGLTHPDVIDHFQLGVADRTLGLRLPHKNRQAGADIRARLQKIGLLRDTGHEHFNGSLVIPVFDEQGNVIEVYGRKIRDDLRAGTPKHLYLPANEQRGRGVFNLSALMASKEILLCEALIDALTFWCAGYRNVTSAYGTEGLTEEHLAAFKRYGTERVLIAYDRDEAGERAAVKVAQPLMAAGIECFRIQFPKGMDANEYALKVQPAAKSLGVLIRKAVWLGKGQAPQAVRGAAPAQPATIARLDRAYLPPPEMSEEVTASSLVAGPTATAEPLPASPQPPAAQDIPLEIRDKEITLTLGEGKDSRRYRVRGWQKNLSVEVLKINLLVGSSEAFHVDTLDLYSAKQRQAYIAQAAQETGLDERLLKTDLGRVLLALEQVQDDTIAQTLQPEPRLLMDEAQQQAALALLRAPNLIERILADFAECGLVGEETNKLVGYLAAVSRKLDRPLGIVIQSSSAAGKTSLMDAVLSFVPEEEKIKYSAMTGQSLFYMGETNLKHKVLAIVEEEGASRASYALKLLQSEGELTMASTGKDPDSGNLITQQYRVQGPVALVVTTTARDIDEELMNRCWVLSVDEGREQTRAIHQRQRDKRTLAGLLARQERQALIERHQNAQRLLKPLDVLNPYAQHLTFPDQTTRLRRDHEKYLTLIDAIALLHQHQREIKTMQHGQRNLEYIEVTREDIALANQIAHDVLGRSLDELPPQTRRLLKLIHAHVVEQSSAQAIRRGDYRFSRKAIREATGLSDTQLRLHLQRLVELEYILVHRGQRGQSFEYELLYDASQAEERTFVPGLIDADALRATTTTASSRGETGRFAGASRPQRGVNAVGARGDELRAEPSAATVAADISETNPKTHSSGLNGTSSSYPQPLALAAAN